eukprot:10399350-Alexandrium_andersonii.AAC.1
MGRCGGFRPCRACGYTRSWAIRTHCFACGAALGGQTGGRAGQSGEKPQLGDWLTVARNGKKQNPQKGGRGPGASWSADASEKERIQASLRSLDAEKDADLVRCLRD